MKILISVATLFYTTAAQSYCHFDGKISSIRFRQNNDRSTMTVSVRDNEPGSFQLTNPSTVTQTILATAIGNDLRICVQMNRSSKEAEVTTIEVMDRLESRARIERRIPLTLD